MGGPLLALCFSVTKADVPPTSTSPWRALHVINYTSDESLSGLEAQIPALAQLGVNCLIVEVNYAFEFQTHPELRQGKTPITRNGAQRLFEVCHHHGIELIPQFQCIGHQSWAETTFPLLTQYPELDLTPGKFPRNKGIYCREWDPTNPRTYEIACALMDELADALHAKAFHVGMDEVFLLTNEHAASTKDRDPAEIFADEVRELHAHLVKRRGLVMLMWADRLIDGKLLGLGEWEASTNGTAAAIDSIPTDIILCPWHYERRQEYPSLPMLMTKGFRILPASWKDTDATLALIKYAQAHNHSGEGKLVGHIFTTWSSPRRDWDRFQPLTEGLKLFDEHVDPKPD
jgi:Glycosyl hydrolase family 20, catalytic domain